MTGSCWWERDRPLKGSLDPGLSGRTGLAAEQDSAAEEEQDEPRLFFCANAEAGEIDSSLEDI